MNDPSDEKYLGITVGRDWVLSIDEQEIVNTKVKEKVQ